MSPFGDEFGEWTSKNGKDVRGQRLFLANNDYRVTVKPGKLYLTFFNEPRAPFEIPALKNKLLRAYQLADRRPLELTTRDGKTTFTLPRPMWDSMATVVAVEFEGTTIIR
jgi:alpha-L-fucosidase